MKQKSWRTTAIGVLSIVAAITAALTAMLDDDPTTNPDWNLVALAIGGGTTAILTQESSKT